MVGVRDIHLQISKTTNAACTFPQGSLLSLHQRTPLQQLQMGECASVLSCGTCNLASISFLLTKLYRIVVIHEVHFFNLTLVSPPYLFDP